MPLRAVDPASALSQVVSYSYSIENRSEEIESAPVFTHKLVGSFLLRADIMAKIGYEYIIMKQLKSNML